MGPGAVEEQERLIVVSSIRICPRQRACNGFQAGATYIWLGKGQ